MTTEQGRQYGVVGMAVMGRSLALNILDHGFSVAVWNRATKLTEAAVAQSGGRMLGASSLAELVSSLERPRRILLMIQAGKPVDLVLEQLEDLLEPGDIVVDGGNSFFEDTRRREAKLKAEGLHFVGLGVSGGEEGARYGPSLMPGGEPEAYRAIAPMLEAISAKTDSGACVTHVGAEGAGHFVKMVHNGIEYADMQLIAEAYQLLGHLGGLSVPAVAETFEGWNRGPLESFLIEITAKILSVKDGDGWLVDRVLDKAGQKGTGRWTAQVALDLGVPVPSIAAAIDARVLSSMKDQRLEASALLRGPSAASGRSSTESLPTAAVHDALHGSKLVAYAQGLALIRAASDAYSWDVDLGEVARIWKGGCIIRARLLDDLMRAFSNREKEPPNLLFDGTFRERIAAAQPGWRRVVSTALERGIPVPAMSASLAYYDSLRSASLPQSLTQAQRDAFGAHTYQRNDEPDPPFIHTDWLG